MRRFLCPSHAHHFKSKPTQLSTERCSVCKWINRPYTLLDFAVEFEEIAQGLRIAHEDPYYDPHGISYAGAIEDIIKEWLKAIHPDYRKNFLDELNKISKI